MRQTRRLICLMYLGYSSLWGCTGTEVGNGARPKDPDEGKETTNKPTSNSPEGMGDGAGGSNGSGGTDTMNSPGMSSASALPYLFAACASPLVEAGVGLFKAADGYELQVVERGANWRVDISQHVLVASGLIKSAATANDPHALTVVDAENLPIAKNYACSAVKTETVAKTEGEQSKRTMTVTTENGAATIQWILLKPVSGSAKVTEIQVKTAGTAIFRRDP